MPSARPLSKITATRMSASVKRSPTAKRLSRHKSGASFSRLVAIHSARTGRMSFLLHSGRKWRITPLFCTGWIDELTASQISRTRARASGSA